MDEGPAVAGDAAVDREGDIAARRREADRPTHIGVIGHAERGVGPAQLDESARELVDVPVLGLARPAEVVDLVARVVAVVVALLRARELAAAVEERDSLAREHHADRELLHHAPRRVAERGLRLRDLVPEHEVVVRARVVDRLGRFLREVVDRARDAAADRVDIAARPRREADRRAVEVASDRVAQVVVEHGDRQALLRALSEVDRPAARPRLAVERGVGADRLRALADGAHGLGLVAAEEIEAEAVDAVLLEPVRHAVDDVLARHRALVGESVARARVVGQAACGRGAEEVVGRGRAERREERAVRGVVVDDIEDDADVVPVERGDGRAEVADRAEGILRVRRVVRLGHIEERGPVAPVVFVDLRGEVVDRKEVHGGHAEFPEMREARDGAVARRRSRVHETEVGAAHAVRDIRTALREVAHMDLVDDLVGRLRELRLRRSREAIGLEAREIRDHGAAAVRVRREAPHVGHLARDAVVREAVAVLDAVKVARDGCPPDALLAAGERDGAGRRRCAARLEDQQFDGVGDGRPGGELRLLGRTERAEPFAERREGGRLEHTARVDRDGRDVCERAVRGGLRVEAEHELRDIGRVDLAREFDREQAVALDGLDALRARGVAAVEHLDRAPLRALEGPRERERDRAVAVEECALDAQAEIDLRRVGREAALARVHPDLGDGALLQLDEAVLVEVLLLPVSASDEEARALRGLRERHDRVAPEGVLAPEVRLGAVAPLGPDPQVPARVVLGGAVVVDDEQRFRGLAADGVLAYLELPGEGREVLRLRGSVRLCAGQRCEGGEQNGSDQDEALNDPHGVECIARLPAGCGTLSP